MSMTVDDLLVEARPTTLVVADRCARCGAQAMMRFVLSLDEDEHLTLDMCKHHGEAHEEALEAQQFVLVEDIRHTLLEARESSA